MSYFFFIFALDNDFFKKSAHLAGRGMKSAKTNNKKNN